MHRRPRDLARCGFCRGGAIDLVRMRGACTARGLCVGVVVVLWVGGGEIEEGSLNSLYVYTLGTGREGCWKATASSIDLRTSISCAAI